MKNTPLGKDPSKRIVVGGYVRFSDSDLQTENSLESQISEIRACAERKGWTFNPEFVFADAGTSGETLDTRPELKALIEIVES